MSVEDVRGLICSARQEAAELCGDAAPPTLPRDALPGFEVLGEIGRGGMGVVYKAIQVSTNRVVAVKIMLGGEFAPLSARKRFQREVELAARLRHPSIVHVLESGFAPGGQPYYVMDYVDGVHLDRWLMSVQSDPRAALMLLAEVCDAVAHSHKRGVVHRDLKPANILVDAVGKPHVLDFGLSKSTAHDISQGLSNKTISIPGQIMGTLRYISPEQAEASPSGVDERTDVYSLGVMLFEALGGTISARLRRGSSGTDGQSHFDREMSLASLSGIVDRDLATIVSKSLEDERGRRYQSASELADDIRRYLAGDPVQAQLPSVAYVVLKKVVKHRVRILLAGAILVLGVVVAAGSVYLNNRSLAMQKAVKFLGGRHSALDVQRLLDMGRAHEASEEAHALATMYPNMPEACLVWAKARFAVAQQVGDESLRDVVLDTLLSKVDGGQSDWVFRSLLSEMRAITGDDDASGTIDNLSLTAPDTAEGWYLRSFASLDIDECLRCAEQAVSLDPQHSLGWERVAHACLRRGRLADALIASERLVELGADRFHWMLFQGRVLTAQGAFAEAVERYTRAAALCPERETPFRARGVALLCQQKYVEAVEDFSAATRTEEGDGVWPRYARATPLWILGFTEEAAEDYRHACRRRIQVSYADARLHLVLRDRACKLEGEGHREESQDVLSEADEVLDEAMRNTMPGSRLHEILRCIAGEVEPGALVDSANLENPEDVCESYYYAGESWLLRGRIDEARACFQSCVDTGLMLDPDSNTMDAMNEYHLALWRLKELTSAQIEGDSGRNDRLAAKGP